jgi:cytochrome b6-f complex iron-sulfur subunit
MLMNTSDQHRDQTERTGRREFLYKVWKILGLVAVAELGFFMISLLKPSRELNKSKAESTIKTIGNVEDFPLNSVTPDRINMLTIIREPDGGFLALSLTCSHLGCSVLWNEAKNQFACPCHSSNFDKQGLVLNSPASRPLDYFPVTIGEGKVKIDISLKTRRNKFEQNQLTYAL